MHINSHIIPFVSSKYRYTKSKEKSNYEQKKIKKEFHLIKQLNNGYREYMCLMFIIKPFLAFWQNFISAEERAGKTFNTNV